MKHYVIIEYQENGRLASIIYRCTTNNWGLLIKIDGKYAADGSIAYQITPIQYNTTKGEWNVNLNNDALNRISYFRVKAIKEYVKVICNLNKDGKLIKRK